MPTISIDKLINTDVYAKGDVDVLNWKFNKVKTLTKGAYIGKMYSYITSTDGKIYMMFYLSPFDFAAANPSYVEYSQSKIDIPKASDIKKIEDEKKEQEKKEQLGAFDYYIQKYVPYVIGAVAISILLPSITKAINQK